VLAGFQPLEHHEIVPGPSSGLDFPWLEITATPVYKRDLTSSRLEYAGGGNGQVPSHRCAEADTDEHPERESHLRIGNFQSHLDCPRRLVHLRLDETDAPRKLASRPGIRCDRGGTAHRTRPMSFWKTCA